MLTFSAQKWRGLCKVRVRVNVEVRRAFSFVPWCDAQVRLRGAHFRHEGGGLCKVRVRVNVEGRRVFSFAPWCDAQVRLGRCDAHVFSTKVERVV